jgi:hypothetical protein
VKVVGTITFNFRTSNDPHGLPGAFPGRP